MKLIAKLPGILVAVLFVCRAFAQTQAPLCILTYNVRNGRGLDHPRLMNVPRIAGVITNQAPDVVALQELDRHTRRSAGRDVLGELADATGMAGSYGEAIPFQGGSYGVGVLSKREPLRSYHLPLPGKEEPRTLLVCEFETFVLFCTHLSLTAESRAASVQVISKEQAAFAKPVLLAGDLNATPDSDAIRAFETSWTRISPPDPTYPAHAPDRTIDYLFVSKNTPVQILASHVVNEPVASDHRPVSARIRFQ